MRNFRKAQNSAKCAKFRIRSAKQRKIGRIWTRKNSAKTERKNALCTSLVATLLYDLVHKLQLFANVACHVSSERMADNMDIFDVEFLNIIKGDRNLPTNYSYVAATLWIIQSGKIFKILKTRKRTHVEEPFFQFIMIKLPFIFS